MKIKSTTFPDRIRHIAEDLSKLRISHDVDSSAKKLRIIANELEHNLKKALLKKTKTR